LVCQFKEGTYIEGVYELSTYLGKYLGLRGEERIGGWRKLLEEEFRICTVYYRGMWWHSWLRHCVTSRKVAGLIPDAVIQIFL